MSNEGIFLDLQLKSPRKKEGKEVEREGNREKKTEEGKFAEYRICIWS